MAKRPKGFGLTAETSNLINAKYDDEAEAEAVDWINDVLGGQELGNVKGRIQFREALKDGIVLCKLINVLCPGSVKKIHPANANHFKHAENISNFLTAAENYGCHRGDLFQSVNLTDPNQNLTVVLNGVHALGRKAQKNGFDGPLLGPKEATANHREFTEEQLLEGRARGY